MDGGAPPALIDVNQRPIGKLGPVESWPVGVAGLALAILGLAVFVLARRRREFGR
jgi:LPXTG-motif cell wall-anchored protein